MEIKEFFERNWGYILGIITTPITFIIWNHMVNTIKRFNNKYKIKRSQVASKTKRPEIIFIRW